MPCSNQKRIQFLSPHRESERRERIRYYTREGGSSVYGATTFVSLRLKISGKKA